MEHLQQQQNNSRRRADDNDMKRTSSDSNDDNHAASALIRKSQLQQLLMFKDLQQQQQQTSRVIERPPRTKRSLPNIPSTVAQHFCSTGSNSAAVRPAVGVAGERSISDNRNPVLTTFSNAVSYAENVVESKEEPHSIMPPVVNSSCSRLSSVSDQRDSSTWHSAVVEVKNKVAVIVDCDSDENESLSDVVVTGRNMATDCHYEPSNRSLHGRTASHQLQSMSRHDEAVAEGTSSRLDPDNDGDRTPTALNGRFRNSVISSSRTNCLNICQLAEVQVDESDDDQLAQSKSAVLSLHDIMDQGYFLHPLTLIVASGPADIGVDTVDCFPNQAIVTACLGNSHHNNPTSVWHRPLLVGADRKHIAANKRELNDVTATFRNNENWIKKVQQETPAGTMARAGNVEKARNRQTLVAIKSLSERMVTVSGVRPLTDGDFLIEINGRYVVGYTATKVAKLLSDAILSSQPLHIVVASTTSTVETEDKELNVADVPSVCDDNGVHRRNALNSCQSKLSSDKPVSQLSQFYYSQDSTSRILDNNPLTLSGSVRRMNTSGTGNDMSMKTSHDVRIGTVMKHPGVTTNQAELASQQAAGCLDRKQRTISFDNNAIAINEHVGATNNKGQEPTADDDVFFNWRGDTAETALEGDRTPAAIQIACHTSNSFDQRADPRNSFGGFSPARLSSTGMTSITNKFPYCDENVDRGFKTGCRSDNSPRGACFIAPRNSDADRQLINNDLNDHNREHYHCQNLQQQHIQSDSSKLETHCYVNNSFNSSRTDPADVRRAAEAAAAAAASAARFVPVSEKATSDDSDCQDDEDETDDDWIQETVYDDEYGWHCVTAV